MATIDSVAELQLKVNIPALLRLVLTKPPTKANACPVCGATQLVADNIRIDCQTALRTALNSEAIKELSV